jgi:glycosyltransferase involved in cell wall biosynthesis
MKILLAAGIYPPDPGGPALHAFRQFKWLTEHGHKAEVVAMAHYRKLPSGARHLVYFCALVTKVWKYDVVYAHDSLGTGLPAFLASKIFLKKFAVRVGGEVAWEREAEKGLKLSMREWYASGAHRTRKNFIISRFVLRSADVIIVPSGILKDVYTKFYNVSSERIKVLSNPWPEKTSPSSKQEQTIVYASRLVAYKNLDFVLKVLSKIFPTYHELKFIIMGDGPEKSRLIGLARNLGIEDKVIFAGTVSQEEVTEKISKCLFAIAPALTEFNPNYILQAISYGKPFLISREHGVAVEVPPELVFDPRNELELESAIKSLLEPQTYQEVLEKVAQIKPKMTWESYQTENLKLVESLV